MYSGEYLDIIEVGIQGPPGIGMPAGGLKDEILTKKSDANYDYEWKRFKTVLEKYEQIPEEELRDGLLWNNTSNDSIQYYDGNSIKSLLYSEGSRYDQVLCGSSLPGGNLVLKSTSSETKGSIIIPEFNFPGFIKNDEFGNILSGQQIEAIDLPSHTSLTTEYGVADKNLYGHVKIGDGIAVDNGVIKIDDNVATLNDRQILINKTLTSPILVSPIIQDENSIIDENGNKLLTFKTKINAKNNIVIENSIINNGPKIYPVGEDENIDLILNSKGHGNVKIDNDVITTNTSFQVVSNKVLIDNVIESVYPREDKINRIYFPDINDTIVTLNATQVLTNKTLTEPKFINQGFIADANGNEQIIFLTIPNAVNELTIENAASGNSPKISASGNDTNIDLVLRGKGTGVVKAGDVGAGFEVVTLQGNQILANKTLTAPKFADGDFIADSSGNEILVFDSVSTAVNSIAIENAATGNAPVIKSVGDNTNVDLVLKAKGAGVVRVNTDIITTNTASQTLENKTLTKPVIGDFSNATHTHTNTATGGQLDHGTALNGLADDDHTQYMLLAGRSGGQILTGGTAANNNITFRTTTSTTKGKYIFTDLPTNGVVKVGESNELISAKIIATDLDPSFLSTNPKLDGELASDSKIASQKAIKIYVDNAITGLSWKTEVRAATTGNITLSGEQVIDDVPVKAGDRVLVKNQTDPTQNGIYIVSTSDWYRAPDADTGEELAQATVFVADGNTLANTGWTCANPTITEWTTPITFVQCSGSGTYTGGTGIDINGNAIEIDSTVVTLTGQQTLTNKILTDNVISSLYQDTAKTKRITFPAVTDTVVTLAASQNLTNKTLTSPSMVTPRFSNNGYIADANGNELLMFGTTPSAVTYLKLTNNTNDADVTLAVAGSTNAGLNIISNGAGTIKVNSDIITTNTATQTLTNKTLIAPIIENFANATHNHTDFTNGGQLTDAVFSNPIGPTKGGTGLSSFTTGDIIYATSTNTLGRLAGNITTDTKILTQTGTGSIAGAPIWQKYKHTEVIGDGINTEYVITHNLNTRACTISVWRTNSPYDEIDYYAEKTSPDTITLFFNRILEPGEFTVVIIG